MRARYILLQWWTCLWLAACGSEAGTFSVSFGFADEKPDPETEYTVYVRVKDQHWTTVAESPRAVFDPEARLQFPSVRNGNSYTIVVELHTPENDRVVYFGRSKPFDLHPGTHVDVQVELAIQAVPRGALRILDARGTSNVRSKVRERLVTLAFSASGATEATLANDEKLKRGKTTRRLSELSQENGEYRWPDWDLDAELCDEPPCLDGEREVYLQLTNSTGYHSEPVRADIELDTTPPELTSHRIEPMTAADGVPTTLQVIASEPLSAIPEVSVLPADFSLTPNMESVPGEMFSFHYTVDAQALDQQAYQFQVKLVDIAGNENDVSLGGASELRIESELRALSTAIERLPAFAPFAGVPVFSRTDPVSGEPVRVRVTVESSRPYDDQHLRLIAQDSRGNTLDFEYVPGDSDKSHAVFTRALTAGDASGSYGLQLDWRDRSGRAGDPDGLRSFTIRDAPKEMRWGVVDSSLDERGEPRTLYTARPWGALTAGGHTALGDSLRGRVVQHAERAEDCIAQLLVYGDASSDGTPRPASLLSVAEVSGVNARGCKTESSTFDVTFSGHSDYHLHVVPVTVSGHRGPAQTIAHNEWVATLPEAVSGGTTAYPHQLLTHMRPPKLPLQAAEPTRLPARSSDVPYAGSWERHRADLVRPLRDYGGMAAVYDPNHGRTLLIASYPAEDATAVWQWDGSAWSVSRSTSIATQQFQALTYDRARDRLLHVGGGHWSEPEASGLRRWIEENKTWEWDGVEWAEQHPVHPLQVQLRVLGYDPARQRSVGLGADARTWEWDGADWSEGPAFPLAEKDGALRVAYDEGNKSLVAVATRKEGTRTFEYTGAQWIERTSPHTPPGFAGAFVAYDSLRTRLILVGTPGGGPLDKSELSTWQWDGVDWSPVDSTERPARACFAMLEDGADRGVSLLCGQSDVTERWRLGPTGWSAVMLPFAPQGRSSAAMTYDERRKRVVLFGGDSPASLDSDQTWELGGSTWQERGVRSPQAISIGGTTRHMAYDGARGVSLYVSPVHSVVSGESYSSETLSYDGASWQSVANTPEFFGRTAYAIAYDSARERTVVFAGAGDSNTPEPLADTWEWDGARWLRAQTETAPSARSDHAMIFDAARSHIVMFGGHPTSNEGAELADTWTWNGREWTQLSVAQSPPARAKHALAFDPERGRVVLFGGQYRSGSTAGPLADTWEWDGSTWTQLISATSPLPRSEHNMVYDPERKRVLLFGGETQNGSEPRETLADLWSWDGTNWVELKLDALPSLQQQPSLAYDAERKQTVMFGGGSQPDADQQVAVTWIWDGEQWLRRTAPAPETRNQAAFAFDPENRRLMLTGGRTRGGNLSDTWAWDGAAWSRIAESGPLGNTRAMTYDSARKRMILVTDSESYGWQGNTWQRLAGASGLQQGIEVEALAYDPSRDRTVLAASIYPADRSEISHVAFEWDGAGWQSRASLDGLLAYDSHRRRLVHLSDEPFRDSTLISDVEDAGLRTLAAKTAPLLSRSALAYDDARRQLLFVGTAYNETLDEMQTWLWSSFVPAHQVMIDLKPLFGSGRTTDAVLDGFAFRATGGASAATEDASNPGVALELWNGREFERVLENDADVDAAGALCFESHDPATLGALEVGKRWPFVLRPAADSDGPEPPRLQTNAFEVRVRYHLRGAEPALPPEPGSTGRRCATDGWAMQDVGASR